MINEIVYQLTEEEREKVYYVFENLKHEVERPTNSNIFKHIVNKFYDKLTSDTKSNKFKFKIVNEEETYYTNCEIKISSFGKPFISLYTKDGKLYTSPNLDCLHLFGEISLVKEGE